MKTLRKAFDWFPILGALQYFFYPTRIRDRRYDTFSEEWFFYQITCMITAAVLNFLYLLWLYLQVKR